MYVVNSWSLCLYLVSSCSLLYLVRSLSLCLYLVSR